MHWKLRPPSGIAIYENFHNENRTIRRTRDKYEAVLLVNVTDSYIMFREKFIKVILMDCHDVRIQMNDGLLVSLDVYKCSNVHLISFRHIPLINIELSARVSVHSFVGIQLLNSFSDDITVSWGTSSVKHHMPIIMFTEHWMWHIPYGTGVQDWRAQEQTFLVHDHELHSVY